MVTGFFIGLVAMYLFCGSLIVTYHNKHAKMLGKALKEKFGEEFEPARYGIVMVISWPQYFWE